ncbi:MAG TPA: outer membrane beta-barrel protein [Devosia sp.]|nr:outer membrane beta-barrel protein [Devosia sp.]
MTNRGSVIRCLAGSAAALFCVALPALAQEAGDGQPADGLDWSIALRGGFSTDNVNGPSYEAIIAPDLSLVRSGERGQTSAGLGGAASIDQNRNVRIDDAHANAGIDYALDEWTGLKGSLGLDLTQLKATDSSLPAGTLTGPLEFTGTAEGSATRRLGRFDLTGTLTGTRFIEGPTTLADHSQVSNADQGYWQGIGALRLGFEVTPLLSVFVEGDEGYQKFDAPSPSLGRFLDGRTTTLRGGVSYADPGTFTAEASVGRAWLDYADPALTDRPAWVGEASLSFTPDETLALTGALETSLGPSSDTPGDTDLGYSLTGEAKYIVNPWLTLRGSAGANRTLTLGSGAIDWGYSAGAGLDWSSSRHVVWSADYLFTHDESSSAGTTDTHAVTVGMTLRR